MKGQIISLGKVMSNFVMLHDFFQGEVAYGMVCDMLFFFKERLDLKIGFETVDTLLIIFYRARQSQLN